LYNYIKNHDEEPIIIPKLKELAMKPGVNESQEDKAAVIKLVDSKFENQQNSIHSVVTNALFNVNTAKAQAVAAVKGGVFLKMMEDNRENDATLQN
jgi:hypothetical protein